MSQPRVTVGVPVYNAERLLEGCLENLAAQTFEDFRVLIFDNASTDGTGAIAQRFAARDSRFTYHRQPQNKGARQNFADVLAAADTPYFMWRADDDSSDTNYIEEMVRLLDQAPNACLAVGHTILDKKGRRRRKAFPNRRWFEPLFVYRVRLLLLSRSSWIYGLFRRTELEQSLTRVYAEFPHFNAFDHLTIFPFIVTLRVVGSDKAKFITGFVDRPTGAQSGALIDPEEMQTLRADFIAYCSRHLPHLMGSRLAAALMTPILGLYAERTYRWLKVRKARRRVNAGEAPWGVTTKYD